MKVLRTLGLMVLTIWIVFVVVTWLDQITTSQTRTWAPVVWIRELDSWMKYVIVPTAITIWIFVTGYVIGCWTMTGLKLTITDTKGDLLAIALGIGLLSTLTYIFGLAGWLLSGPFAVLGLCICASGYRFIWAGTHRIRAGLRSILSWRWQDKVLLAVIIWYLVRTFLLIFNPATGWDECNSHLAMAKWYVRTGSIEFLPWMNFNNFPMGLESLLMLQFMGTDYPGVVVPYGFLILTLCVIYMLGCYMVSGYQVHLSNFDGKMMMGVDPASQIEITKRTGGLLACIIFLMVPAVTSYSQIVKPTMPLIFYSAMLAWAIFIMPRIWTSYVIWGLLAGILISMKYTGILWALLMTVCVMFYLAPWKRVKLSTHIKHVSIYIGAMLLVASPWMVRNAILFGSPVFPFFNDLIPPEWGTVAPALKAELAVKSQVMLKLFHVENPWLVVWHNAMREDGDWAPHGRPGTSGPWLIALLPMVLFCWRSIPMYIRWLLAVSVVYVTAWWLGWRLNETRYIMPALPGFCVVAGLAVAKLLEGNDG